jgi:hypothetical protein
MSSNQFPQKKSKKIGKVMTPKGVPSVNEKPKGPIPASYLPNQEQQAAQAAQQAAERLAAEMKAHEQALALDQTDLNHMRSFYSNLVAGIPGDYSVGCIKDGQLIWDEYRVGILHTEVPVEKPPVVIYGYRDVYIHLECLFQSVEQIQLQPGWLGNIQVKMIDFLREHLADEIAFMKAERDRQAFMQGGPRLATSDGKPVVASHDTKTPKPAKEFTLETVGRFNFCEGLGRHCVVVQEPVGGYMMIKVISLAKGHTLARKGVRMGIWIYSDDVKAGIPDVAREKLGDEYFAHAKYLREFILAKLDKKKVTATVAA